MLTPLTSGTSVSFESFLDNDLRRDLLRFTTAGSVDDGKSTLIGRLLHDAQAVYEDQLAAVRKSRVNRSGAAIDFSLLTDGLRAEREQGITIDVAYRYFSTARRKFIIADTPGHEQYTRNMATGASTADLAIILVDATRGLQPQTRRHAYIASLLGISTVVAAINKMDLVNFDADTFLALERDFQQLARSLRIPSGQAIPISALAGDNVVTRSQNMPWYDGPALLEYLETVSAQPARTSDAFRFPVQCVIRADANFRGYAGRIAGGIVRPGDAVIALPSGRRTVVQRIVSYSGDLDVAVSSQSVTLKLADEIDLSRGDILVSPDDPPIVSNSFAAMVVWFDAQPLELGRTYLLKHTGRQVKANARRIRYGVNVNQLTPVPANRLEMNEIASVEFETSSELYFDSYDRNRTTGSFILIDPISNATAGAGMMLDETQQADADRARIPVPIVDLPATRDAFFRVSLQERSERHGHPSAIFFVGDPRFAESLERNLFDRNFYAIHIRGEDVSPEALPAVIRTVWSAGLIVLYSEETFIPQKRDACKSLAGEFFFDLSAGSKTADHGVFLRALNIAERLRAQIRDTKREEID